MFFKYKNIPSVHALCACSVPGTVHSSREVLVKDHSPCSQRTSTQPGTHRPDTGCQDGRNAFRDGLDREGLSRAPGVGEVRVLGHSRTKAQRAGLWLPGEVLASGWDFTSQVGIPEAWKAKLRGRKVSGVCRAFG